MILRFESHKRTKLWQVEGKDIEEVRWNSIVNRTVLERIRPLENKLHYQVNGDVDSTIY